MFSGLPSPGAEAGALGQQHSTCRAENSCAPVTSSSHTQPLTFCFLFNPRVRMSSKYKGILKRKKKQCQSAACVMILQEVVEFRRQRSKMWAYDQGLSWATCWPMISVHTILKLTAEGRHTAANVLALDSGPAAMTRPGKTTVRDEDRAKGRRWRLHSKLSP